MPRVCITVNGKNSQPYRFTLERKIVRLGRSSDNDIVVDDTSVSSHHCEMRRVDGGYILQDLDSTNGIKLDSDRMEIIDLRNGQEISVGDAALDFELTPEETESLSQEKHRPQQRRKLPAAKKADPEKETTPKEKSATPESTEPARKTPPATRRPVPAQPRTVASATSKPAPSAAVSFGSTLVFLVLAALSFYLGLASKHWGQKRGMLFFGGSQVEVSPVEGQQEEDSD